SSELRAYKGGDPKQTLYDFMGLTELAADTFRITQTSERIKSQNANGLNKTSYIANNVGQEVRDIMMKSSGVAPEELSLEGDIKKIKTKIKSTSKKLKKADAE
ncbi:MAG: damage-inducible protein D, partial [Comamonas sp.]